MVCQIHIDWTIYGARLKLLLWCRVCCSFGVIIIIDELAQDAYTVIKLRAVFDTIYNWDFPRYHELVLN